MKYAVLLKKISFLKIILPSESSVSVRHPKFIFAVYFLNSSCNEDISFVLAPVHIMTTPSANGSSVPAWTALTLYFFIVLWK